MLKKITLIISSFLAVVCASPSIAASEEGFRQWLADFRNEMPALGLNSQSAYDAVDAISFDAKVLRLDKAQPENKKKFFGSYQTRILNDGTISRARLEYKKNQKLLAKIEQDFGVPGQYVIALWAIESGFGQNTGNFEILDSLATLAYEGRRHELFKDELVKALGMLQSGDADAADLIGSWAGAMGQCQFMPSAFVKYAIDYDGDGKKNIWKTRADVFASIANYLATEGWTGSEWGYPVILPEGMDISALGRANKKTMQEWQSLGVVDSGGYALQGNWNGGIVVIDENVDNSFMVSPNYDIIMKWNRSVYFATSVGMLADRIVE